MSNTGICRPYWDRNKKRWVAIQMVKGVRTVARFYTEEAAQKWFDAPLEHPRLPVRYEGSVKRRARSPVGVYLPSYRIEGDDVT